MGNQQTPQPQYQQTVVIVGKRKSVGVAFLLAFLFGPLGLLYASVVGGIVMFFLGILIAIVTFGFGLIFVWIGCIIWAIIAANNANKKMANGAGININTNFGNLPTQQPPTTQTINPQPQVQQQYTPPVQQPQTMQAPSPSFSEQIAPVVSSIGDFISKNKILLISAIAIVGCLTIGLLKYFDLRNHQQIQSSGTVNPIGNSAHAQFNERDIQRMVDEYLQRNMQSSVDYVTSLYADKVDFYNSGIVDKNYIIKDKKDYFFKWPERNITLTGDIDVITGSEKRTWLAKFNFHYQYKNPKKNLHGEAWCMLIFKAAGSSLFIISEKGGIINNNSSR